ncbi:hypothetical protein GPN2_11756 [Streptomyces murinus]
MNNVHRTGRWPRTATGAVRRRRVLTRSHRRGYLKPSCSPITGDGPRANASAKLTPFDRY